MTLQTTPAGTVSADQLARLLLITPTRVRQLVTAGAIPRSGRDTYPLVGAVQGYLKWLLDEGRQASRSAPAQRMTNARAEEIEQRLAQRANSTVPTEDLRGVIDLIVGVVIDELETLPTRLPESVKKDAREDVKKSIIRIKKATDISLISIL